MDSASLTLPPLGEIAAALLKTTETLAHALAVPAGEPPQWSEFEWHIARAATAMHGVTSLLDEGLRWNGPDSWRGFLSEQRDQTIGRHLQISRLLTAIDALACREGIALVALKGAALYATGIYKPGERPMGDIDLLVRDEDAAGAAALLDACNYEAAFSIGRHEVFQPRVRRVPTSAALGEHVDNPIKIEVHTRIAEQLPVRTTDITRFIWPKDAHAGINPYPSAASLMMHLILHAAGNMRARALRLIQLHDIARLAMRFGPLDWQALLDAGAEGGGSWWMSAPLMLTARYYPSAIPPAVLASLNLQCPWLLRKHVRQQRLTDVSWSNIRIQAFPGVEWARSPLEAIQFMKSRIWPSRQARLELKEGAAQIPGSTTVPWYGISHAARILRWVFSRPPRVQTLLSVRAALAQP
jgi:hypothetical protein